MADHARIDEAIAMLEVASIAMGLYLCDVLVKQAPVRLLNAEAVSPGKFLILFAGDVASVEESYRVGLEHAGCEVLEGFFLPHLHREILPGLAGHVRSDVIDAVGLYELQTVSSGIVAADAALKQSDVHLVSFRMARGIGGKSYFVLTGSHADVLFALEVADRHAIEAGTKVRGFVIPNPHEEFLPVILGIQDGLL
ncbi:MAG: BMC domain-containing protein [Candidatus Sericytochromatia bacterium]|nr:BMC domain-containing protein [Candidatus Sericytochromatia bacterium]